MTQPNIALTDEDIDLMHNLIRAYRSAYAFKEIDGIGTTHGALKRLERKLEKALDHPDTEFV